MADEPDNQTDPNETPAAQAPEPEAPATETPEAQAPEQEAPVAEAPEEPAPEQEVPATETPEVPAPEQEAPATETPEVQAVVPPEPAEQLSPKERRRRKRAAHAGEARPPRSAEERHAERLAERKDKAVRRRTRRLAERAKAVERRATAPAREPLAPVHAPVEGTRKVRQGIVVSDKADKTITVRIDTARRHRRYEKIVRSSSTLHAHDENNEAHEGDVVRVIESRPLSRLKRWKLVDVLERAR